VQERLEHEDAKTTIDPHTVLDLGSAARVAERHAEAKTGQGQTETDAAGRRAAAHVPLGQTGANARQTVESPSI
jgi:hypothetical protein